MGRWKALPDKERLWRFLVTLHAHPWARLSDIVALSGLGERGANSVALPLARRFGCVERVDLPMPARAEQRYGLSVRGAEALEQPYDRPRLRDAFLQANHLDGARQLLAGWSSMIVWSASPLVVPARDLRPPRQARPAQPKSEKREPRNGPYRSLHLDALACVQIAKHGFTHLAILVDPGVLDMDWYFQQFRSVHAWRRRAEFWGDLNRFPIFVVIARIAARQAALLEAWREAAEVANRGEPAAELRLIHWAALSQPAAQRRWADQRYGHVAQPWHDGGWFRSKSQAPTFDGRPWWGGAAATQASSGLTLPRKRQPRGNFVSGLTAARALKNRQAALLHAHQALSVRGRNLLNPLGQYPLITPNELAIVLGRSTKTIYNGLEDLIELKLVTHPAPGEHGYVLSGLGLALLAAQIGMRPAEYAQQRHWPTYRDGHTLAYSAQGLLACRAHSRLVLAFLVGLRQYGPRARVALASWEHVDCLHEYPFETATGAPAKQPFKPAPEDPFHPTVSRIIPDATGTIIVVGDSLEQFAETTFWLEIDRGTERGRALLDKLNRYYRHAQQYPPWARQLPRLLIVVEHNDQPRLDYLRQRLLRLQKSYGLALDVRLTRADLLAAPRGTLDPTRNVWRKLDKDGYLSAFNQPPATTEPKP